MLKRTILILALTAGLCTGCETLDNATEKSLGEPFEYELGASYRQQLEAQKFNPVPADDTPVVGEDGHVAQRILESYRRPTEEEKGPGFNDIVQLLMSEDQHSN